MRFLFRLALLLRRPVQEVAAWPDAVIVQWAHYLSNEPAPEERLELAVAQLTALLFNVNRGNSQSLGAADFLLFKDAWKE